MWVLTVCIGILWGGTCDKVVQVTYPTEQSCIFEKDRVNRQLRDGYAVCTVKEKV